MPNVPVNLEDLGASVKYFEYRDMPARKLSPEHVPEIYRPGKGWEAVKSSWDFMHNYVPCDEARIKEMIARLEG